MDFAHVAIYFYTCSVAFHPKHVPKPSEKCHKSVPTMIFASLSACLKHVFIFIFDSTKLGPDNKTPRRKNHGESDFQVKNSNF